MKPEYEPRTTEERLGYLVEECAEVLKAAGKTLRFGYSGSNPELLPKKRETNAAWLRRELVDLEGAIRRVRIDLPAEPRKHEAT